MKLTPEKATTLTDAQLKAVINHYLSSTPSKGHQQNLDIAMAEAKRRS